MCGKSWENQISCNKNQTEFKQGSCNMNFAKVFNSEEKATGRIPLMQLIITLRPGWKMNHDHITVN